MIARITNLKQFGIFRDFTWSDDIPEFSKLNLIYGWNRSGKTTLSRVFSACERRSADFDGYPNEGEFSVKTDTGQDIGNADLTTCGLAIKVFNRDFIDENISFDPSGACTPIIYVGEEDIESKRRLDALKKDRVKLAEKLRSATEVREVKEKAEDQFRISVAQTVSSHLTNKGVHDRYFAYDKRKVQERIDGVGIDGFAVLSDDTFAGYEQLIRSEAKQKQENVSKLEVAFTLGDQTLASFGEIHAAIAQVLSKQVVSETIARLKDDRDLRDWVQGGFDLHRARKEKEKCLFCQKPLDEEFLNALSSHFSSEYEDLQDAIRKCISELDSLRCEGLPEENKRLYYDLFSDYQNQVKQINAVADRLNGWLDFATEKLEEKLQSPLSLVEMDQLPEAYETLYDGSVDELNAVILKHNEKVDNHETEVKDANGHVEDHLLAVAIDVQGYRTIRRELHDSRVKEGKVREGITTTDDAVRVLENKTSDIGMALQSINTHLKEFFGRDEIQLELDDGKKGYVIKRDGEPANNLSEGEKTAIAFSYFIVKVHERDFDIGEGIVYIDDPVSSFDVNFIYHCFAVIRHHFKEAHQLFISTHNFELFSLLKDWFLRKRQGSGVASFYMIENIVIEDRRSARLQRLEDTLLKFRSEYHFLFARLHSFLEESSPDYADFYIIGNIARRFLEIFTGFKIPTTGDLLSKIGQLDTGALSETEIGRVYKLIQEFSHGSDLTSSIEHKDKREVQDAVRVLLRIIEAADLKHYEALEKSLS